jgi:hypothetical protein
MFVGLYRYRHSCTKMLAIFHFPLTVLRLLHTHTEGRIYVSVVLLRRPKSQVHFGTFFIREVAIVVYTSHKKNQLVAGDAVYLISSFI